MTTDITELAQMKGQKVEGSYYLAECTDCGKMYPSNKLNGGEPLFSGDYGECYCPHCNADDAAIGDCGDTAATAWNYQQNRIDALVEALEKAQTINAAAEKLVRCKGRYHSEQNYRALAALFGVNTPDLPPMDGEPVAWQIHTPETGVTYVETKKQSVENIRNGFGIKVEITPLYRHAQQPVVSELSAPGVPTFDQWMEISGRKPLGWVKDAMRESYDACRAAMLNGGKL